MITPHTQAAVAVEIVQVREVFRREANPPASSSAYHISSRDAVIGLGVVGGDTAAGMPAGVPKGVAATIAGGLMSLGSRMSDKK